MRPFIEKLSKAIEERGICKSLEGAYFFVHVDNLSFPIEGNSIYYCYMKFLEIEDTNTQISYHVKLEEDEEERLKEAIRVLVDRTESNIINQIMNL